jgi:polar amino acid transport system substrate-binding protein
MSEVDRPGVRIAVQARGAADRLVTPIIKVATVIRVATIADAIEMLRAGQADVVPANKTNLFPALDRLPGARILEGRIGFSEQGIGVPRSGTWHHVRAQVRGRSESTGVHARSN